MQHFPKMVGYHVVFLPFQKTQLNRKMWNFWERTFAIMNIALEISLIVKAFRQSFSKLGIVLKSKLQSKQSKNMAVL